MNGAEVKYIVDDKGDRTAVIIPINEYEELMEDLHDLAVIAERRDEPTTSFEELKRKLRADGVL
jgi:PHD/YefM family antitoxin component YafN of YafNO toxin-antitoxin module